MDQRVEFVLRARRGEDTIAALCREYVISRPTGYLWLQRYQSAGSVKALAEHSRRPWHSPRRTNEELEAAVLAVRDEKGWGGAKIAKVLGRQGLQVTAVTAQRILKRTGRVAKPAGYKATQRFAREQCNELAQMISRVSTPCLTRSVIRSRCWMTAVVICTACGPCRARRGRV